MIYFLKNELEVTEKGKTGGRNERQAEGTVWGRALLPGTLCWGQERGVWGSKGELGPTMAHGFHLACYHFGKPMAGPGGERRRALLILMGTVKSVSAA